MAADGADRLLRADGVGAVTRCASVEVGASVVIIFSNRPKTIGVDVNVEG